MPAGMEDVTELPRITEALLRRGYTEADVKMVFGGNLLRLMEQVEQVARRLQAAKSLAPIRHHLSGGPPGPRQGGIT